MDCLQFEFSPGCLGNKCESVSAPLSDSIVVCPTPIAKIRVKRYMER